MVIIMVMMVNNDGDDAGDNYGNNDGDDDC